MVATYKDTVLCYTSIETLDSHDISITHCQSEEADQRLIRHTLHCISAQYKKAVVRTVDTDVLILLMSYVSQFYNLCTDINIYVHMVNSACEYYDVIDAIFDLGKETCNTLPFFYAFTGCDTASNIVLKCKCRVWGAWHQSEQKDVLTNFFSELGNKPSRISLDQINVLGKFVLEIYGVRKVDSLTQACHDKSMISTDNDLWKPPPGREASIHHTKRACYQTGYLWKESIDNFDLPDPKAWGWGKKVTITMVLCGN